MGKTGGEQAMHRLGLGDTYFGRVRKKKQCIRTGWGAGWVVQAVISSKATLT